MRLGIADKDRRKLKEMAGIVERWDSTVLDGGGMSGGVAWELSCRVNLMW